MPSIGVAIPCYYGHINSLKLLLDSIEIQTRKPDLVVISCSSSNDKDIPYKQENYSFPFIIYTHIEKMNAAQNRNFAARHLDTDIISFIDADDQMHPQRIEIIEKAFKENDIVLFLHSFTMHNNTEIDEIYDIDSIKFDINKLDINYSGWGLRHLEKSNADIHNGHSSVRRYILENIQYGESSYYHTREDSGFTADVFRSFPNKNGYSILPLSKYFPSKTGGYIA